jgi:translation initiation factor eIF-2B subunit alpha
MADTQTKVNAFSPQLLVEKFRSWLQEDHNLAEAMAGVKALTEVVRSSKAETMMGLQIELEEAVKAISQVSSSLSLKSGCELFQRYVTRTYLDIPDFEQCKQKLINRGEQFTKKTQTSRMRISTLGETFIQDGMIVLTHGYSRVVLSVLMAALEKKKRFRVILTESKPETNVKKAVDTLLKNKVPITIIPDSTAAYIMNQVDMVLVGAEAVVENGGVINKVGTYQIGILAKAMNKPCYVAAESFKFTRLYPLTQLEIPNRAAPNRSEELKNIIPADLSKDDLNSLKLETPMLDYTPPQFITLLFTDLGVLTPSAVSDELIKLYY